MKKFIFPAILLALLAGCGSVKKTPGTDNDINIVSGTANGTTTNIMDYEKGAVTGKPSTSDVTTKKVAGKKVGGTTSEGHLTKKSVTPVQTRSSNGGNDGVVHGTTRAVPSVQRNTTTPSSSTETTSQTPTFDPKDYSSISFALGTKFNEINVLRPFSNGEEKSVQSINDVDASEILEELEKNPTKKIEDFMIKEDFDFDGYPDLFIIENQDEFKKTGKYYHYDHEKGIYTAWSEMNELKNLIETEYLSHENIVVYYKSEEDNSEYTSKTYEWDDNSKLVLRQSMHQFEDADYGLLIESVFYDESGRETGRETRDSSGSIVSVDIEE